MNRLLLAGLLFLVFAMAISLFTGTPSKVSTSDQMVFKDQVLKVLGPIPSSWSTIQFDEISERSYGLTLVYMHTPSNLQQVQNDTRRIARGVLKALMDKGRSPHQEMITVFVHAQIPERGETGAGMVRYFGKTMYDYNDDQLVFKPAKS